MFFEPQDFTYFIAAISIVLFKYTVLFLLPFNELKKTATGKAIQDAEFAAKFDKFEKFWLTFVSENKNNQPNNSNNADTTSNEASTSDSNTNSHASTSNDNSNHCASASADTKPASSSSGYVSAASSASSSSSESLQATVKHVRDQYIAAALDLSDKIDGLKEENKALKAHTVALQSQLAKEKTKADDFSDTIANRINMLEHYVQNDAKLEDQRKRRVNQVQVMAHKNTDAINERISQMEDQLTRSFQEVEDKRATELEALAGTFQSLRKRCDEFKVELDQHSQQTAQQAKDTAANTSIIQETRASDALAILGNNVRGAIDLCEAKLHQVVTESEMLQAAVEGTGKDIEMFHERVVGLESEFDDMREEVRSELSEMNRALGSMEEDVHNIKRELHVHSSPDQETTGAAGDDDTL